MHDYKKLKVWEDSISLVNDVYKLTKEFPKHEEYILKNQMLRAAISIPSNIAEGCGRNSQKDFCRFLDITTGSLNELQTQLIISRNANYISEDDLSNLSKQIHFISNMIRRLKSSQKKE